MSRLMTKPTKWHVRPAKTLISLGIHPVWSESSLSTWRKLGPLATHWVHSEDSDQTGQMPRLIWVFAGHTVILLVLSRGGSNVKSLASPYSNADRMTNSVDPDQIKGAVWSGLQFTQIFQYQYLGSPASVILWMNVMTLMSQEENRHSWILEPEPHGWPVNFLTA